MSLLAAVGTLAYNGFTFNGSTRTRITVRSVPDRANRTTVYNTYVIEAWTTIVAEAGAGYDASAQMINVRQQLTATAGRLQFTGHGFNDMDINGVSGVRDVTYGPHPEIIEAVPIGIPATWMIHWRCVTSVPDCPNAAYQGRPLAHNYEVEITADEHGMQIRTVTGTVEIPATRNSQGDRSVPDSGDNYFQQVLAGIPQLFSFQRRTSRKLSEDKRTLHYTIVDFEKPPDGFIENCTDWEGEHELVAQKGGIEAASNITCTYYLEVGQPKRNALDKFFNLVTARVLFGLPFMALGSLIPLRFIIRDQLHGQRVTFSLDYTFAARSPLELLAASGMWTLIPNSNYFNWRGSVGLSQSGLGNAQLIYNASSDSIVDLCAGNQAGMTSSGTAPNSTELQSLGGFFATLPPPNQSYLRYEMGVTTLVSADLVFQKPINTDLQASDYQQNVLSTDNPRFGGNQPYFSGTLENQTPDIPQVQAAADYEIILWGSSLRAGYPVPCPGLVAYAGLPLYLVDVKFNEWIGANAGIPIHAAQWQLYYRLPSAPLSTVQPGNPELRTGLGFNP